MKFENSFFVFFFVLACERIFIKADSTESRCVIGLESILGFFFFWGEGGGICESFSPEILQAGAVKGLIMNAHWYLPVSTQAIQLHNL